MSLVLLSLGVFLSIFGLFGFLNVIYAGFKIRKQNETFHGDRTNDRFERLLIINYLSLCLSAFGLIILVLGILLR